MMRTLIVFLPVVWIASTHADPPPTAKPTPTAKPRPTFTTTVVIDISEVGAFEATSGRESSPDLKRLVDYLKSKVDPESWSAESVKIEPIAGGKLLLVTQSQENQDQILSLIQRMRLFKRGVSQSDYDAFIRRSFERQERPLLLIADFDSPRCGEFFQQWDSSANESRRERSSLLCVHRWSLSQSDPELPERFPFNGSGLYAIDSDGSVAATLPDAKWNEGLTDFWDRHLIELPDANLEFEKGLEKAGKQDKHVFLLVSNAKGCGSCDRLKTVLGLHRESLAKDYVTVIIDPRMENCQAIARRYGQTDDWAPWYAIVLPDRRLVINSESATGNIGFPLDQPDREHFKRMIVAGQKRISNQEIDALMKTLGGGESTR